MIEVQALRQAAALTSSLWAAGMRNRLFVDCASRLRRYRFHRPAADPGDLGRLYPPDRPRRAATGDLLLYSSNDGAANGIHHVGIYLGGDRMVEAPQSGDIVKISAGIWGGNRGSEFLGAVRPGA